MNGPRRPQRDWPAKLLTGLSEAELWQAYGLVDVRAMSHNTPPVTVETVRSRLAAAADEDPAERAVNRERIAP